MSQTKPSVDDLRRFIGYLIITFTSVFLYFPVLWFIQLFSQTSGLYTRWLACSAFLVIFNIVFYFWKYPKDWLKNLLLLAGINVLTMIFEYFWLIQGLH